MTKTKIYQVKKGYNVLGSFEKMDDATEFFATLVKSSGKVLQSVSNRKGNKVGHYFDSEQELSIKIVEVILYSNKKEAEFAAFNNDGDEESQAE